MAASPSPSPSGPSQKEPSEPRKTSALEPSTLMRHPQAKRAFHRKARTGCKTCRIRRVRCDEGKPACDRCSSTGRICDGYVTEPSQSASSARELISALPIATSTGANSAPHVGAGAQLRALSRDPGEIRSFQYFVEVAAPSIGGCSNNQFWAHEVPVACRMDPAIWHAVISLGAVYEDRARLALAGKQVRQPVRNSFALQHFNASVRHLLHAGGQSSDGKWRALVLSAIFSCACTVDGLYEQARAHFESGCKILREADIESARGGQDQGMLLPAHRSLQEPTKSTPWSVRTPARPVSMASIRRVLIGLYSRGRDLENGGILNVSSCLSPDDGSCNIWQAYTATSLSYSRGKVLTDENLLIANRAAHSLLEENLAFLRRHDEALKRLFTEDAVEIAKDISILKKPILRCFNQLSEAASVFSRKLVDKESEAESREMAQLRLSLYLLRMYVAVNKLFTATHMDMLRTHDELPSLSEACYTSVDLAERICDLEASFKARYGQTPTAPNPPLLFPMSIVAIAGSTSGLRRRAIEILKRPRLEGLFDSPLVASLSSATMIAEMAADREYRQQTRAGQSGTGPACVPQVALDEDEVESLSRSLSSCLISATRGEAVVQVQTWREWMNRKPGRQMEIHW